MGSISLQTVFVAAPFAFTPILANLGCRLGARLFAGKRAEVWFITALAALGAALASLVSPFFLILSTGPQFHGLLTTFRLAWFLALAAPLYSAVAILTTLNSYRFDREGGVSAAAARLSLYTGLVSLLVLTRLYLKLLHEPTLYENFWLY